MEPGIGQVTGIGTLFHKPAGSGNFHDGRSASRSSIDRSVAEIRPVVR